MKYGILVLVALAIASASAQQAAGGREAFLRQQAYGEMQRVSAQVDTLQSNFDDLNRRVAQVERGANTQALQAEVASLRSAVAELRRELASQREEIVRELSQRIAKMQPKEQPAPPPPPKYRVVTGPTSTYEVASGDNLSLVAKAFNTTVAKLRELNNLKSDNLKIGQKLIVPQN